MYDIFISTLEKSPDIQPASNDHFKTIYYAKIAAVEL